MWIKDKIKIFLRKICRMSNKKKKTKKYDSKIKIPKPPKITIPKYLLYPPKTRIPILYPKKSRGINKRTSRRTVRRIYKKHKRK